MACVSVIKWLPYVIFLLLCAVYGVDSSDTGGTTVKLVDATQTSLTFAMDTCFGRYFDSCNLTWVYFKGPLFTTASTDHVEYIGNSRTKIESLAPGFVYRVKVGPESLLQEMKYSKTHFRHEITVIEASTCPAPPEKILHIHTDDKDSDYIKISWAAPSKACLSTAYYVRWHEYNEETHNWNPKYEECPPDSVFVANTTDALCEDDPETICYTIKENITASTQYVVEVITTDYTGRCSNPENTYVKTRYDYWGGITIGAWCLIVMCFILAIGAMPLVIRMKRRLAMQMASKENIIFKRSTRNEDSLEDEERDPDGYLISNSSERNIEIQRSQP